MKTIASIIVASHLSDLEIETSSNIKEHVNDRINFIKFIIFKCNNNLNIEIDPDDMWNDFIKWKNK